MQLHQLFIATRTLASYCKKNIKSPTDMPITHASQPFCFRSQTNLAVDCQWNLLVPSSASSRQSHCVISMVTLIWFHLTTPVSSIQAACSTCRWVMPTISLTNRSSVAQLIEHGTLATHTYEIILSISVFLLFANIYSAISNKYNQLQIINIEMKNWHFPLMAFMVSSLHYLSLARSLSRSLSPHLSLSTLCSAVSWLS